MTDKTNVPPNWKSFLRDNNNKTELLGFLADKIVKLCQQNVVIMIKEQVLCNKTESLEESTPCNHEEADTRIFLHALHAVEQKNKCVNQQNKVLIKVCDKDILAIAVSAFGTL